MLRFKLKAIWNIVRNRPVVFRAMVASDGHLFIAKESHLVILCNRFTENAMVQPRENWIAVADIPLMQTFR